MSRIMLPGQMELHYPAHNLFGVPRELTDRLIKTTAVIDFARTGLPAKYLIKNPLIRRGRTLVKGIELDSLAEKKFWLEAQGKDSDLPEYRLGIYDPEARGELVDWCGRIYGPTYHEQLRLRKAALKYSRVVRERCRPGLRLAAYPGIW